MDISKYVAELQRQVVETDEAFIFHTIEPFVKSITSMEITKEELTQAIVLVRIKKECSDKYGCLVSDDFYTATRQRAELNKAYERGFKDGQTSAYKSIADQWEIYSRNLEIEECYE